ncbi:MAG: VOC family protein [Candidatus Bathyarchaeota archaeon]|jgi:catechol 2,3-dioxygenase-like lactoylglutathione lyase family enzyme
MTAPSLLDHILIVVKDLERSIGFYKLLGFKHLETIQRPKDRVAVLRLGSTKIELMNLPEGKETIQPPRRLTDLGFRHIGFSVEDVGDMYERLKDKIEFISPPRKIPGRGDRTTVFFRDPDGVEMHLVQE